MAEITQNNIITSLLFKTNLEAVKKAQEQVTKLAETTKNSVSTINKSINLTKQQLKSELDIRNKIAQAIDKSAIKEEALAKKQQIKDFSKQGKVDSKVALDTANLNLAKDLMKATGLEANQLSIGLKNMGLQLKGGKIFNKFNEELKVSNSLINQLRRSSWRFNMNTLTVMFGLMALKRVLTSFGKSAISTYQKANEDTQGLGKSTWALQAAWEFLKYSLVDALTQSPLFKILVEWILQLVMWFNKLPASVKGIIALGLAFLFVIVAVGFLITQLWPLISFFVSLLPAAITASFSAFLVFFGWLLLIVGIIVALWVSDFAGFQKFIKTTLGIIWITFKMIFGSIFKLISLVFGFIVAIFKGDFDKAASIAWNFFKELVSMLFKAGLGIGAALTNIIKFCINSIFSFIEISVNGAIWAINLLIEAINSVTGVKIPIIPELDLSSFKMAYGTVDELQKMFGGVDSFMGLNKEVDKLAETPSNTESTKTKVDNSTNNFELNFNMPEGVTDIDNLSNMVMDKLSDQLNSKNDSTA